MLSHTPLVALSRPSAEKVGKIKDLAGRYRQLQAQAEDSASELAAARQREEELLGEASAATREGLERGVEEANSAAAARITELENSAVLASEEAQGRIVELVEQLDAARRGESAEATVLQGKLAKAAEERDTSVGQARELRAELERLRQGTSELSAALEESQAREWEADELAKGRAAEIEIATIGGRAQVAALESRANEAEVAAKEAEDAAEEKTAAFAARLSEMGARLEEQTTLVDELRASGETAEARNEEARGEVRRLEVQLEGAARGESEHVATMQAQLVEAQAARVASEEAARTMREELVRRTEERERARGELLEAKERVGEETARSEALKEKMAQVSDGCTIHIHGGRCEKGGGVALLGLPCGCVVMLYLLVLGNTCKEWVNVARVWGRRSNARFFLLVFIIFATRQRKGY